VRRVIVNGGLILGGADWRASIFEHHMPQVLQAFRHGDWEHFSTYPDLDRASIKVHFHTRQTMHQRIVGWGTCTDYRIDLD